jgi:hypothetical protein
MSHLVWGRVNFRTVGGGLLISFLFGGGWALPASAEETYRAQLVQTQAVEGVKWSPSPDTWKPIVEDDPNKSGKIVRLKGVFADKGASLLFRSVMVPLGPKGEFSLEIPIQSEQNNFALLSVAAAGAVRTGKYSIEFPQWAEMTGGKNDPAKKKRYSITTGVGGTYVMYQQTSVPSFSEMALTFKAAGQFTIKGPWDIGVSGYAALPMSTTVPGYSLSFFGGNLRLGYRIFPPVKTWNLMVMGGVYYSTTQSAVGIGYKNFMGPQLYPVLRKDLGQDRGLWFYLKFSPLMDGFSFVNLSSAEYAGGGGYQFPIRMFGKRRVFSATLDLAMLGVQIDGSRTLQSMSSTVGINYHW